MKRWEEPEFQQELALLSKDEDAGGVVSRLLDTALLLEKRKEKKRSYLGASRWGEKCERRLGYEWHEQPKDPGRDFTGRLFRIFERGHVGEDSVANNLRLAGFDLLTHKADGSQWGFVAAGGKLSGHIDGVLLSGPPVPELVYPALWENKVLNNKSFNQTLNKGVRESKPVYFAQSQTYMAYLQLESCLFTFVNADTMQVEHEVILPEGAVAQQLSDKAVRIIQSQNPEELPRITGDPSSFDCKWCDYRLTCWKNRLAGQPEKPSIMLFHP